MVSFNNIPSTLRVPLFYAEMDNSAANIAQFSQRALLIGQKLAAGSAVTGSAMLVSRTSEAEALFGRGSMLARMHAAWRANDPFGEIWCIAVADPAGAAAAGSISVAGPASAAGTLSLYIAGQRIQVAVAANDAASAIATAIANAVNAASDLPITAAVDGTVNTKVNLTARWVGATGNDITVMLNYRGTAGGEATPAGVTLTIAAMAGGTGAPDLAPAITAMGDEEYDFITLPYSDSASLDALKTEMNDTAGRWSYARQVYGHVYSALRGTLSALVSAGSARNDQHASLAGFETEVPNPAWEYAAAYAARNAVFLRADPARPTQTGELTGILPAPAGKRFLMTERQSLLTNGVASSYYAGSAMRVERAITTYQKNASGQADTSYLDSETLHTSAYVLRSLRAAITSKYARHKLANDGTRYGAGQAIVTPSVVRGEMMASYAALEDQGIVENAQLFAKYLVVERDATNPNRLNVLFPPDYVNQLRVFAVLAQFRLNYPATA